MPAPVAAYAAINSIPALYKLISSGIQSSRAKKLERERPTMELSESTLGATDIMERLASQTELPGQQAIEQRMGSDTASTVEQIQASTDSPAALMGALTDLHSNQMRTEQDLGIAGAQMQQQNLAALAQQRNIQAREEQKVWDYNVNQPYQQDSAAASALKGASMQNLFGGLTDLAGTATGAITMNNMLKNGVNPYTGQTTGGGFEGAVRGMTDAGVSALNAAPQEQPNELSNLSIFADSRGEAVESIQDNPLMDRAKFENLKFTSSPRAFNPNYYNPAFNNRYRTSRNAYKIGSLNY